MAFTQPDISSQIRRLRKTQGAGSAGAIPAGQRATGASLRSMLAAALDRNRQLADENARLRRQLARALGDQRPARTRSGNRSRLRLTRTFKITSRRAGRCGSRPWQAAPAT